MKPVLLLLALLVSALAGAEDRAAAGQKRAAQMGGVTVSVTPLNLAERGSATIDFKLIMDTHAGALPSNVLAFARLVGEKGTEILPFSWDGGSAGHHLSGKLSFPADGSEPRGVLTLVLKSVDGRNDMRFEWKIPSKSAINSTGGA